MKDSACPDVGITGERGDTVPAVFWGCIGAGWSSSIAVMTVAGLFLPGHQLLSWMILPSAALCWTVAGAAGTRSVSEKTLMRKGVALLAIVQVFAAILFPAFLELTADWQRQFMIPALAAAVFPVGFQSGRLLRLARRWRAHSCGRGRHIFYLTSGVLAALPLSLMVTMRQGVMQGLLVGPACYLAAAAFAEDLEW